MWRITGALLYSVVLVKHPLLYLLIHKQKCLTTVIELEVIGEEQARFREGYCTTDHMFVLNSLLQLYLSKEKE